MGLIIVEAVDLNGMPVSESQYVENNLYQGSGGIDVWAPGQQINVPDRADDWWYTSTSSVGKYSANLDIKYCSD